MKRFAFLLLAVLVAAFLFTMFRNGESPGQTLQRIMDSVGKLTSPEVSTEPTPSPTATPSPAQPSLATPTPTAPPPTPPTSTATPPPLSDPIGWLLGQREMWPSEVILKSPVVFPVVVDGKTSGHITLKAGSRAKLLGFDSTRAVVGVADTRKTIKIEETNLKEGATVLMRRLDGAGKPR